MARLTRKEFAELCGVSNAYVTQYIGRGKIIEEKFEGYRKKMIDTDNLYNKDFMSSRVLKATQEKLKTVSAEKGLEVELKIKPKKKTPVKKTVLQRKVDVREESIPVQDNDPELSGSDISGYDLDNLKKQRDIELKEVNIRINTLKEKKMMGDLIPKDLVQRMISQLSQSFLQTYTDKSEVFLVNASHRNKLSADATAELKGELIQMINIAHDKAITEAKKEFKTIVSDVKNNEL